jgi:hypothetical protein
VKRRDSGCLWLMLRSAWARINPVRPAPMIITCFGLESLAIPFERGPPLESAIVYFFVKLAVDGVFSKAICPVVKLPRVEIQ